MYLPLNSIISVEKICNYLLKPRIEDDKSKFLNSLGYNLSNWNTLITDIREQILINEAEYHKSNKFGDFYSVIGQLKGRNRKVVNIITIWIKLFETN
jgi:hypothetical protein